MLAYEKVLKDVGKTFHLLVGNGFSVACDPIFSYENLYDKAVKTGLSARAVKLFEKLGTNNFEAVMRLLDDGNWLAGVYDLTDPEKSELKKDLEILKNTLIEVISASHLSHPGAIAAERQKKASEFFQPYANIFCINYDLLAYWVSNWTSDPPIFEDGFRADTDGADDSTLVFSERVRDKKGLFYIHGGLHIFNGAGGIRKYSWKRSGNKKITELVREGLKEKRYPLFVAEGKSENKQTQIASNAYLHYCLGKLSRIESPLITFGFSFGDSDSHIEKELVENLALPKIYIGVYGSVDEPQNKHFKFVQERMSKKREELVKKFKQNKKAKELEVVFYNTQTISVWK